MSETSAWRAFAAAASFLILCACSREPSPAPSQPGGGAPERIVLITVDTLRADRLHCYGSNSVATPAIDRLATDGVLFRQAVAQVPLTLPSHCSILTGTYPSAHGVHDQAGFSLGAQPPTLAELLERAGYATGGFVGSSVLSAGTGIGRGFRRYSDVPLSTAGGGVPRDGLERRGDQVVSEALAWLEEPGRGRAFVWIHLWDPHTPYAAPEPFKSRYGAAPYDGEVAFVDSLIGMLIERLERRGWYDNSLIVFTSDHGEALGEHGESTHGFFLYDATLRVPLIIKPVAGGGAGRVLSGQVRSIDIAPTVLGLAGIERDPRMQGESLAPRFAGTAADTPLDAYSETYFPYFHFEWSPLTALRTGKYKYIDAPRPELYDLERDPREESNRLRNEPSVTAELEGRLRATYPRVLPGDGGVSAPAPVDRATVERLRSLGYVGAAPARRRRRLTELPDPKDKIGLYEQLQRALYAAEQGRFEESSAGLRRVLAQDDHILDAHLNLGVNLVQTGGVRRSRGILPARARARPEKCPGELQSRPLPRTARAARRRYPRLPPHARARPQRSPGAGGARTRLSTQGRPRPGDRVLAPCA